MKSKNKNCIVEKEKKKSIFELAKEKQNKETEDSAKSKERTQISKKKSTEDIDKEDRNANKSKRKKTFKKESDDVGKGETLIKVKRAEKNEKVDFKEGDKRKKTSKKDSDDLGKAKPLIKVKKAEKDLKTNVKEEDKSKSKKNNKKCSDVAEKGENKSGKIELSEDSKHIKQGVKKFAQTVDSNKLIGKKEKGSTIKDSKGDKKKKSKPVLIPRKHPNLVPVGVELTDVEKEILRGGTTKDRINLLTLVILKNPCSENFKNLLVYTENQRNDTVYYVLKNLRDILLNIEIKDIYIKNRIVKTLSFHTRNSFIKHRVIDLIYDLLKSDIFFLDLIYIYINKIGDKGEIESKVVDNLKSLFYVREDIVLDNLEDFWFKNPVFKSRNSVLKLMDDVVPTNHNRMLQAYSTFLDNFTSDLPTEQRNILLERILGGISRILDAITSSSNNDSEGIELSSKDVVNNSNFEGLDIKNIELLRTSLLTPKMCKYTFKILYYIKDSEIKNVLFTILSNNLVSDDQDFINTVFIYTLESKDDSIVKYLINTSIMYSATHILSVLHILNRYTKEKEMKLNKIFGFGLLKLHFSPIVRKSVADILNGKEMQNFNPFDLVETSLIEERICDNLDAAV